MTARTQAIGAAVLAGSLVVVGGGLAGIGQTAQEIDKKCEETRIDPGFADACPFGPWPGAVPGATTGWAGLSWRHSAHHDVTEIHVLNVGAATTEVLVALHWVNGAVQCEQASMVPSGALLVVRSADVVTGECGPGVQIGGWVRVQAGEPVVPSGWITSRLVEPSATGGPPDVVAYATSNVEWSPLA